VIDQGLLTILALAATPLSSTPPIECMARLEYTSNIATDWLYGSITTEQEGLLACSQRTCRGNKSFPVAQANCCHRRTAILHSDQSMSTDLIYGDHLYKAQLLSDGSLPLAVTRSGIRMMLQGLLCNPSEQAKQARSAIIGIQVGLSLLHIAVFFSHSLSPYLTVHRVLSPPHSIHATMAPDLNSLSSGEQMDYSQPGSSGYNVRQDATWMDPQNRRLRVLSIGAGVSGILMAYQIQKLCENVEHVIYEKNEDIAGTWLENRYPGCACDIPSHAYTYNFALNPDWPKFFSHSPDIFAYLEKVVATFDLRKYMNFNTEVVGCYWQEEKGEWLVKLREHRPGQEPRDFEDHCHLLLHGTGLLVRYRRLQPEMMSETLY